jgi:hypothetical protein
MELSDLIPDGSAAWKVGKNQLTYKKYVNIPICYIGEDGVVYVFLDKRISKQVLKITKRLVWLGVEFYFTTPELSNPKGVEDHKNAIILHYFRSYIQKEFFEGFEMIQFDLIHNMTKWAGKEDCFNLIKENYEEIKKIVNRQEYDYYSNIKKYEYPQEIRDDFDRIYREIQINRIL